MQAAMRWQRGRGPGAPPEALTWRPRRTRHVRVRLVLLLPPLTALLAARAGPRDPCRHHRRKCTSACFATTPLPSWNVDSRRVIRHHPGAARAPRPRHHTRRSQGVCQQRRRFHRHRDRHCHRPGHGLDRGRPQSPRARDRRKTAGRCWSRRGGANRALLVDVATDRVQAEMPVAQAHNGTIGADGRAAWVGSQQQGATALVKLDLVGKSGGGPRAARQDSARARIRAPTGGGSHSTVAGGQRRDGARHLAPTASPGQIPGRGVPASSAVHAGWPLGAGPRARVRASSASSMSAPAASRRRCPVGKTPHWVAVSSDGRTAFVTNEGSNDLADRRSSPTRQVKATIPVGNAPRKVAVQPGSLGAAQAPPAPGASPGPPVPPPTVNSPDHGTRDVAGQSSVQVARGRRSRLRPDLCARPGRTSAIRLSVENRSTVLHNVSVPALGIDRDLTPGSQVQLDVAFPTAGATAFFCKFHSPPSVRTGHLVDGRGADLASAPAAGGSPCVSRARSRSAGGAG